MQPWRLAIAKFLALVYARGWVAASLFNASSYHRQCRPVYQFYSRVFIWGASGAEISHYLSPWQRFESLTSDSPAYQPLGYCASQRCSRTSKNPKHTEFFLSTSSRLNVRFVNQLVVTVLYYIDHTLIFFR